MPWKLYKKPLKMVCRIGFKPDLNYVPFLPDLTLLNSVATMGRIIDCGGLVVSVNVEIHGSCDPRFDSVKKAFEANFTAGSEIGASFALTVDGKSVVDIWGGFADRACTRPWERDTIVTVFSTTKTMASICTMILVDRGLLDLDAPVACYWPEFALAGKEQLLLRYLLSHSSGLAGFKKFTVPEQLYDWNYIVTMLAGQKPLWDPGKQSGYHALTMGYLLGEVVRRVTGKSLGTFFHEEVAEPLKADFHIGLPAEYDRRVAEIIPYPVLKPGDPGYLPLDPATIRGKVEMNQPQSLHFANDLPWRRAEIPAANGHGNARSIARIGSALACGGKVDAVRLMNQPTVEKVIEEQTNGNDLVLNTPIRWGLGFEITTPERPLGPHPRTFSWGGAGGSILVVDLDARVSWAYVMNKMNQGPHFLDPRNRAISKAIDRIIK
jgi:CubicO group peptidase (beta-lactamase class C family)